MNKKIKIPVNLNGIDIYVEAEISDNDIVIEYEENTIIITRSDLNELAETGGDQC